jgi:type IV pilus assembly protein PilX
MRDKPAHQQRGVVLFVVLIMLLLLGIAAMLGLRTVVLEERMTASARDRAMGLESAERALREAEKKIAAEDHASGILQDCSKRGNPAAGFCTPFPRSVGGTSEGYAWHQAPDIQDKASSAGSPEYAIQYVGQRDTGSDMGLSDDPNYGVPGGKVEAAYYRVLARGADPAAAKATDRAVVVLQTSVVRE